MQLKPGTKLQNGKYEIIKTLGQGGFGITYLAEQMALHRKVAIKEFFMKEYCERDETTKLVTLGTSSGSKELVSRFREKFIREAQMIAGLEHPHIVKIYDVFEENGTAYYVMEFLEGESLSDRVKETGPLPEKEALKYIRQVGEALSYLHGQNCLHFDVKPSNILVNKSGNAVLIDFGVSKHYDAAGSQTSSTPVGISRGYAPMEQYQQNEISTFTPATDIYALGATLFTLLTGEVPPSASEVYEDGVPSMSEKVSKATRAAVEKAMQPRRKDRPQTVGAFISLLDADYEGTIVDPKPKPEPVPKPKSEPIPAPTPIPSLKPQPPTPAPEKKKFKTWLWALLGSIAAAAIIVALVLGGKPATGTIEGHEWVDLGLSVKWATCNVGATMPEDYGSYFAWGETTPKGEYTWENYKYRAGGNLWDNATFSKYNAKSNRGTVDNKKQLDLSDDAARANWGGTWRMPTDEEMTELEEKCNWEWTKMGDKEGYKVTSKTNGNSIFLPATSYRDDTGLSDVGFLDDIGLADDGFLDDGGLDDERYSGYYWSSSLWAGNPDYAWHMYFYYSDEVLRHYTHRYYGFSIRPVTE